MNNLYQLSVRNIKQRKGRFLISLLTIALGISLIFGIAIVNESIREKLRRQFEHYVGKDHFIIKPAYPKGKFDEELFKKIKNTKGVKEASVGGRGRLYYWRDKKKETFMFEVIDTKDVKEFKEFENRKKNFKKYHGCELLSGRFFNKNEKYSIILTEEIMEGLKKKIGDKITVYPSVMMNEKEKKEFEIIGFFNQPKGKYWYRCLIPLNAYKEITFYHYYGGSLYEIRVSIDITEKVSKVEERLNKLLGDSFFLLSAKDYGKARAFDPFFEFIIFGLTLVSYTALVIGILLIGNIFAVTVQERLHEFGIIRTIGATKLQIFKILIFEAFIFGVIGSILGILIGIGLSKLLIRLTEVMILWEGALLFKIPIKELPYAIFTGIIASFIAVLLPAINAARASPIEQIRLRAKVKLIFESKFTLILGIIFLIFSFPFLYFYYYEEYLVYSIAIGGTFVTIATIFLVPFIYPFLSGFACKIIEKIFSRKEAMILKNSLNWNRHRIIISIFALSFSITIMIIMLGLEKSSVTSFEIFLDKRFPADGVIYTLPVPVELEPHLLKIDGIKELSRINYLSWTVLNSPVGIVFFDIEKYKKLGGSFWLQEGEEHKVFDKLSKGKRVLISYDFARRKDLKIGDILPIKTAKGTINFEIVGISYGAMEGIIMSWEDMQKYFEIDYIDGWIVKLNKGANVNEIKKKITSTLGIYGSFFTMEEEKKMMRKSAMSFAGFFKIIFLITLIVTSICIFNTILLNVLERTREIGILRAIGLTKKDIFKLIITESIAICIAGCTIGILAGVYVLKGYIECMQQFIFIKTYFMLPYLGLILSILIASIISILGGLYPARRASTLNVIDALRYE